MMVEALPEVEGLISDIQSHPNTRLDSNTLDKFSKLSVNNLKAVLLQVNGPKADTLSENIPDDKLDEGCLLKTIL